MDLITDLGYLALASRLKRLGDRLQTAVSEVYAAQELDFRARWFPLLAALDRETPQPVTRLASRLGLTHTAIAQIGAEMEAEGLIRSESDPQDGRRRLFALTEQGRRTVERLQPLWAEIERATAEVVAESGHDLLAAVAAVERRLAQRGVPERMRPAETRARPQVEIVGWRPELAAAFRTLNLEWIETYFAVEPADLEVLDDPASAIVAPRDQGSGGEVLFALADGEAVGTCALIPAGDSVELAKMAVSPGWQGRGIGRRLGLAAIAWARSRGFRTLFLLTNPRLESAVALYRALGFAETAQAPATHGHYERASLVMQLPLATDSSLRPTLEEKLR